MGITEREKDRFHSLRAAERFANALEELDTEDNHALVSKIKGHPAALIERLREAYLLLTPDAAHAVQCYFADAIAQYVPSDDSTISEEDLFAPLEMAPVFTYVLPQKYHLAYGCMASAIRRAARVSNSPDERRYVRRGAIVQSSITCDLYALERDDTQWNDPTLVSYLTWFADNAEGIRPIASILSEHAVDGVPSIEMCREFVRISSAGNVALMDGAL